MTTQAATPAARADGSPAGRVAYYLVALLVLAAFVFPLVWAGQSSLRAGGTGGGWTVENYRRLLDAGILRNLGNSAIAAVCSAVLTVVLSTLGGYGFARFPFPGSRLLFLVLLGTLMVPFQGILIPLYLVLHQLGGTNSVPGLIAVYLTFQLPFGLFVMTNAFAQVPKAIEEAALVEGASALRILVTVLRPLVFPGMVTVALYAFIFSWNEFLAALSYLTGADTATLPVALSNLQTGAFGTVDVGILQAGAVLSVVPCLAVFFCLQRYYVRGLTSGAVKV